MPRKGDRANFIGLRFGKWLVTGDAPDRRQRDRYVHCICDCGNKKEINLRSLVNGQSVSCGCEGRNRLADATRTHGMSSFGPEYDVWVGMMSRCHNQNSDAYKNYGGRGIVVCDAWHDVRNFLKDMGHRPSPKHSIERRDNERGYSHDNCYWATKHDQVRNTRRNVFLEIDGQILTMKDAAKHLGMCYATLRQRFRNGWTVEKAISTPVDLTKGYNRKHPTP